ncbi:Iron/zinc purple acid phosphatase-like C-terminal domain protein [Kalmanozyma brasiliensis GHG001]|uniref:Purple acid phosphatase n=1 Tax=Kalmanozyma brasiliensis (strain GHG001) TaxID=1365824 RepID=V5F3S4_KALBG|nr:Iron/zinc purple acid phosphatase-like C-terminal domain protein [Kalmanozyma brasiliensis GHG001]EST10219.1 Iron/zinc purple acid phosphatase-like C-terminal domain protein [Kalmanozyma brasiliensis GHG001]
MLTNFRTLYAALALAFALGGTVQALAPGFKPSLPFSLPPIPSNLPSSPTGSTPAFPGGLPVLPSPAQWADARLNDYRPSKARLAYRGDQGMAVSWSTPKQLPLPAVLFGKTPSLLDRIATSTTSITYNTSTYYSNHVILDGLEPNSKYYYLPILGDPVKDVRSFTTAYTPGDTTPYTIAVVADLGTMGSLGLSDHVPPGAANPLTTGEITTIQRLTMTQTTYDHIMHVGDIAYADYWLKEVVLGYINGSIAAGPQLYEQINEEFYDEMEPLTSSLPYHVLPGNHDSNCDNSGYKNYTESICPPALTHFTGYNQHWNMPSDLSGGFKNMFHSYDVGMVHYVVYDTETDLGGGLVGPEDAGGSSGANDGPLTSGSAQMDFLRKDLASVDRTKTPWVIAAGHRPWYMAAKSSSLCTVCQTAFEQLFNDHGVDLVLNGHQHNMQRQTPLLPGGVIDPNGLNNPKGPMYILTGAAGHFDGLDAAKTPFPAYTQFVNDTLYGFSRLTFHNRTHLTHEFVSSKTGSVLDSATLYKQH